MKKQHATAYHEAGHAIIAHALGIRVYKVSIVPGEDYSGVCAQAGFNGYFAKPHEFYRRTTAALAGIEAQRRYCHQSIRSYHTHSDYSRVATYAVEASQGDSKEADALIAWLRIRTANLVRFYWPAIEALAKTLVEKKTVGRVDVLEAYRERLTKCD